MLLNYQYQSPTHSTYPHNYNTKPNQIPPSQSNSTITTPHPIHPSIYPLITTSSLIDNPSAITEQPSSPNPTTLNPIHP
ncbi:hypothetical protein ASPFODRAFT_276844 [Aspergillus luchuensis CBS 106.47]|uniref:Uncharacterized protein n=1 Tax=Aspergillus luchuensis (strain CBS 106.47) TaxID=1137211 RepID=A0A1M3U179_ASPLC|nr:hypothetical protein ASPFODRAFT_276844 [Aspergillus luchuensis CBS 106.47]